MVLAVNARNADAQNQLRRRRVVEVESSNEESGGFSQRSDSNHDDRRRRRRDNHPRQQQHRREEEFKVDFSVFQEPQKRTMTCFVHGLNEEIASKVELQSFWTLADVKKLAIKIEKQVKTGKKPFTRSYNTVTSFNPKIASKGDASSSTKKEEKKPTATPTDLNCEEEDECPNRRVMTFQDIQEIEEELKHDSLDLAVVDQNPQ
ncbi:hypothetical protein EUTSA_v10003484mg, partial [Eutrema salsugineum]